MNHIFFPGFANTIRRNISAEWEHNGFMGTMRYVWSALTDWSVPKVKDPNPPPYYNANNQFNGQPPSRPAQTKKRRRKFEANGTKRRRRKRPQGGPIRQPQRPLQRPRVTPIQSSGEETYQRHTLPSQNHNVHHLTQDPFASQEQFNTPAPPVQHHRVVPEQQHQPPPPRSQEQGDFAGFGSYFENSDFAP